MLLARVVVMAYGVTKETLALTEEIRDKLDELRHAVEHDDYRWIERLIGELSTLQEVCRQAFLNS